MMSVKNVMFKKIKLIILSIGIGFLFTLLIYPIPNKHYGNLFFGFFIGFWHGIVIIPNYIISLFDSTRLIKASSYDGWYNFSWWLGVFIQLNNYLTILFKISIFSWILKFKNFIKSKVFLVVERMTYSSIIAKVNIAMSKYKVDESKENLQGVELDDYIFEIQNKIYEEYIKPEILKVGMPSLTKRAHAKAIELIAEKLKEKFINKVI